MINKLKRRQQKKNMFSESDSLICLRRCL